MLSHNTIAAHFTVAGQKLPVSHFYLTEAISRPSELKLQTKAMHLQKGADWIGAKVHFSIENVGGQVRDWFLLCEEVQVEDDALTLVCRSPWSACFKVKRTQRVFCQINLPDLIRSMIPHTRWFLSHDAWMRAQVVQCTENDGEFIQRIGGRENWQWFARYENEQEILHIVDHPRFFEQRKEALVYRPAQVFDEMPQPGVTQLEYFHRSVLQPKEWLEDMPLRLYSGIPCVQAGLRSAGMSAKSYQPLSYEASQLEKILKARMIRSEDLAESGYRAVRLQSNQADLAPGMLIDVASEAGVSYAQGYYRVNYVLHSGQSEQEGEGSVLRYHNTIIGQDSESPFRGVLNPSPMMPLVFQARIESNNELTHLNDNGRETVRSLLDQHPSENTQASIPIPRLTPYAHASGGMQCPLYPGTEVLMTCLHAEPDFPVILGAVFDDINSSPVTHVNPWINMLRTQQNQTLIFDDTPLAPLISLTTQSGHEWIMRNKISPGFFVTCVGGMIMRSQGNFQWHTGQYFSIWAGETYQQRAGIRQRIVTKTGDIAFKSATNMSMHALNCLSYEAKRDFSVRCKDQHLNIQHHQNIQISQGDADFIIAGASLVEISKQITVSSVRGDILLKNHAGACGIKLTQSGEIYIFGQTIKANTELQKHAGTITHC